MPGVALEVQGQPTALAVLGLDPISPRGSHVHSQPWALLLVLPRATIDLGPPPIKLDLPPRVAVRVM